MAGAQLLPLQIPIGNTYSRHPACRATRSLSCSCAHVQRCPAFHCLCQTIYDFFGFSNAASPCWARRPCRVHPACRGHDRARCGPAVCRRAPAGRGRLFRLCLDRSPAHGFRCSTSAAKAIGLLAFCLAFGGDLCLVDLGVGQQRLGLHPASGLADRSQLPVAGMLVCSAAYAAQHTSTHICCRAWGLASGHVADHSCAHPVSLRSAAGRHKFGSTTPGRTLQPFPNDLARRQHRCKP